MAGRSVNVPHEHKQKGPAETAISPSHGPNNPKQEMAMDSQKHTSEAAPAAMPDFRAAFEALEEKISRVVRFAQAVDYLATEDVFDRALEHGGQRHFYVHETAGEIVRFLAEEAKLAAQDLEGAWVATHNAGCKVEHAELLTGAR